MKRKINKIFIFTLIILTLSAFLGLSACYNENKIFTDACSNLYFNWLFGNAQSPEDIVIESVTAYYYNNYYYFEAEFSVNEGNSNWEELNKISVLAKNEYILDFCPHHGPQFFPDDYESYTIAKEKGKKKVYSKEEIERYKDEYYEENS